MSRYTKTFLSADGQKAQDSAFMGWDTLRGESEEATHAEWLGTVMDENEAAHFASLESGQCKVHGIVEYFREY